MVARFVGNFYKLESWPQDIPYMILGNETKLRGVYGKRNIGLSTVPKNVKVADLLSNSGWFLLAATSQDLQKVGESIRAIRPLQSDQQDTITWMPNYSVFHKNMHQDRR